MVQAFNPQQLADEAGGLRLPWSQANQAYKVRPPYFKKEKEKSLSVQIKPTWALIFKIVQPFLKSLTFT